MFPSPVTIVKSREKKCRNHFRVTTITTNDMVKCHQRERSRRKMMDFDYCEYIKQNIIMAVLRKTHSHALVISRLMEKSIM